MNDEPRGSDRPMDHRKIHLWEKLHVELVGGGALAAVYYWLWPLVGWTDSQTAVAFLATGHLGDLAGLLLVLLVTSAVCAAVTIAARPMGSMLAALVGICGVCCHSPGMRTVFWAKPGSTPGTIFALMAAEVFLLGVLFSLASVVVEVVRIAVGRILPGWLWKDPLADLTAEQRHEELADGVNPRGDLAHVMGPILLDVLIHVGKKGSRDAGKRAWDRPMFFRCLACGVTGALLAVLPLLLLMQSAERGQVLFALLGSFLLAALLAHQRFPAPYSVVAILMATFTAVAFYTTAAVATAGLEAGVNVWMLAPVHSGPSVLPYAAPLPLDWVTAGGGGAVIGFWISERIHEMRYVEENDPSLVEREF